MLFRLSYSATAKDQLPEKTRSVSSNTTAKRTNLIQGLNCSRSSDGVLIRRARGNFQDVEKFLQQHILLQLVDSSTRRSGTLSESSRPRPNDNSSRYPEAVEKDQVGGIGSGGASGFGKVAATKVEEAAQKRKLPRREHREPDSPTSDGRHQVWKEEQNSAVEALVGRLR